MADEEKTRGEKQSEMAQVGEKCSNSSMEHAWVVRRGGGYGIAGQFRRHKFFFRQLDGAGPAVRAALPTQDVFEPT